MGGKRFVFMQRKTICDILMRPIFDEIIKEKETKPLGVT
jgi:hypothetical protein